MNELKIFENPDFGTIRTITEDGKTMFCGTDVAKALGYAIPTKAVNTHCKGVSKMETPTKGGIQEMLFIPEGDVYRLIVRSKLPTAERFERWVFDEVLPIIRKTGGYIPTTPEMSEMEILSRAVLIGQRTIEQQKKLLQEQQEKLEVQKPKVLLADSISETKNTILIRDLAKILKQNGVDTGEKRLFGWLRKNGYLTKNNRPTQRSMEQKLFVLTESTINHNGKILINFTVRVTGKGQGYFVNKFLA